MCTGLGEGLRERHSEPGGGAGDDDDLVVEPKQIEQAHDGFLSTWRAIAYLCTSVGPS